MDLAKRGGIEPPFTYPLR